MTAAGLLKLHFSHGAQARPVEISQAVIPRKEVAGNVPPVAFPFPQRIHIGPCHAMAENRSLGRIVVGLFLGGNTDTHVIAVLQRIGRITGSHQGQRTLGRKRIHRCPVGLLARRERIKEIGISMLCNLILHHVKSLIPLRKGIRNRRTVISPTLLTGNLAHKGLLPVGHIGLDDKVLTVGIKRLGRSPVADKKFLGWHIYHFYGENGHLNQVLVGEVIVPVVELESYVFYQIAAIAHLLTVDEHARMDRGAEIGL